MNLKLLERTVLELVYVAACTQTESSKNQESAAVVLGSDGCYTGERYRKQQEHGRSACTCVADRTADRWCASARRHVGGSNQAEELADAN